MEVISSFFSQFKALPPAETLVTDEKEIQSTYRYWRIRTLYSCFIGYAIFYFCRVNISMAIPAMEEDLGYSKTKLGLIVSALQIMYGIGKFTNGILADRANPRYFMAFGLLLSAIVNIVFGLSASLIVLVILWGMNGWFQSMGFPPGARLLSHWYSPSEYGRIWGLYGCSHQVGAAAIIIIAGYAVTLGWQYVFILSALFAILAALFLFNRLRDVPETMGLPPVEAHTGDVTDKKILDALEVQPSVKETLLKYVLNNKFVWFTTFGNMFLYIARYGLLTWAPSFIKANKGVTITKAGWVLAFFEIFGILGMLSAGWISDRISKARRGPVMAVYMFALSFGVFAFWISPPGRPLLFTIALAICGFLVYGPLMLVSVAVAGYAGKKAAATASGFSGLGGYIGATISGVGVGFAADTFGWTGGFALIIGSGILSAFFFALTWNARPRAFTETGQTE
jgi:glycerol-3-phosphate transporter